MAKEITLEELASNANKQKIREVSISEISNTLPPKQTEEPTNPPLVEDAFNNLFNKFNSIKTEFEERVLPEREAAAISEELDRELAELDEEYNPGEDMEVQEEEGVENAQYLHVLSEPKPDLPHDIYSSGGDSITISTNKNLLDTFIKLDDIEEEEEMPNDNNNSYDLEPESKEYYEEEVQEEEYDELDNLLSELDEEDDDEFLLSETDDEEDIEEAKKRFKKSLSSVKITNDNLDLSEFTITKKPVSISMALNTINHNRTKKHADWALYYSGRSVRFVECDGPELDALRKTIQSSNGVNAVISSLRFIYDHIIDANKPDFELWCKTTRTEDVESLYFGLYRACYSDTNIIPRVCEDDEENKKNNLPNGCGKTSLITTDINEMVKYKDDKVKEKFNKIMNQDTTTSKFTNKSHILPLSDTIAISYSNPTIYTTFIQYASISPDLLNKYTDLLNSLAYITGFYYINPQTKQLAPIDIKTYPNNLNKTVLSRIKAYRNILKTLTVDQYNIAKAKLDNLTEDQVISYVYPKSVCPECGHNIEEEEIPSVINMLFTRAQLAQVKSL